MLKKTSSILLVTIVLIVILFSLIKQKGFLIKRIPPENRTYKLVDSYNREVIIDKNATRIISVAPNITEIIFALGKGDLLVGRTDYCNYPEEVRKVDSIGSIMEPNIEKIVQLNPDLVIASTHFKKEVLKKLEELGIKVAVFYDQQTFTGVFQTINKVGKVLNAEKEAEKLVSDLKKKVDFVTLKVKGKNRPKVFYVISYGNSWNFTAGQDTFIGSMFEMAGGDNVAKDSKGWSYSIEKLVEKNPDIIICSKFYNTKKTLEAAPGYRDLKAVKEGRLVAIDHNLLDRQGPRLADGLIVLAKIFHPEIFNAPEEKI